GHLDLNGIQIKLGSIALVTTEPGGSAGMAGSIVYASNQGGKYQLYRLELGSNSPPKVLGASKFDDFGPALSHDGSKIAFTSNRSGGNELWIMDSDGNNARRLTFT